MKTFVFAVFVFFSAYMAGAQNASALIDAIDKGNVAEVEKLLTSNKFELNSRDGDGFAAMHYAAKKGNVEVGKLLLKYGADVNFESEEQSDDRTVRNQPIHFAARNKNIAFVKFLLENGADINAEGDEAEVTALHIAAQNKDTSLIKYLIFKDAEIDKTDYMGARALQYAIYSNCVTCVEILLDNGSSPDDGRVHGAIPLFLAVEQNNVEIARLLINKGADVNNRYRENENTPLHEAIYKGNLEMVLALIAGDADLNETSGDPPMNALQITEALMKTHKKDKDKYANYYKMAGYIKKAYNPKK